MSAPLLEDRACNVPGDSCGNCSEVLVMVYVCDPSLSLLDELCPLHISPPEQVYEYLTQKERKALNSGSRC